jgi:hypothetical protein
MATVIEGNTVINIIPYGPKFLKNINMTTVVTTHTVPTVILKNDHQPTLVYYR